jgi:hypothetical protein
MKMQNPGHVSNDVGEENPGVGERERMAPRTPVEELIAGIYASNLNVSFLGIYDNLPALGFTPQIAARLKSCLQQVFHVEASVEQLLSCATIDSVVNLLSELWGGREIVEEIAWTFLQIDQLSDDEVRSRLAIECSSAQAMSEKPDRERGG